LIRVLSPLAVVVIGTLAGCSPTLTGDVDSQSKRAQAEEVAATVLNVQQLVNERASESVKGNVVKLGRDYDYP